MLVYLAIIFTVFLLSFSLNSQNSEAMLLKYNGKINDYKLKIFLIAVILIFFCWSSLQCWCRLHSICFEF